VNVAIDYLLRAVIDSLDREVLPHLEPKARPASNVRACLMLLEHIETRVAQDAKRLFEDNRELRALLQKASDQGTHVGLDAGLCDALRETLERHPAQETFFDQREAGEANRDMQELLTRVIDRLHSSGHDAGDFSRSLHAYLEATADRELQLVEKALGRVPV
jgi:hypothetical protein